MLPRPISICETDKERNALRIVYRVAGKGTEEFSQCKAGDRLDILGPLGNGFPLERCPKGKKAFLIGGGIGIPPMVQLAKEVEGEVQVVAGYRDELFLTDELIEHGTLYVATEDGSTGTRGNVLDCIREHGLNAGFPWKKRWPAELAHAWPVSATPEKLMTIRRCITNVFVKKALCSGQKILNCRYSRQLYVTCGSKTQTVLLLIYRGYADKK